MVGNAAMPVGRGQARNWIDFSTVVIGGDSSIW
jgi:hypothetical protein